jgi:hypothetical protein
MDDLDARRGTFRLGVMVTAVAAMILALAVTAPLDGRSLPGWIALGLFGVTGIGLLRRARFARVLAGLGLLACALFTPVSLIQMLSRGVRPDGWDPMWLGFVANATATKLLVIWLCVRGIQALLGRSPRASDLTVRLVGGVLMIIAAHHLWLASQPGVAPSGTWSVNLSIDGTILVGFAGWQPWHGIALVLGLVMVAGPRRVLAPATTALVVLMAALVPLVIVAMADMRLFVLQVTFFGMLAFPVYLAWWLRDETHRRARAGLGAPGL